MLKDIPVFAFAIAAYAATRRDAAAQRARDEAKALDPRERLVWPRQSHVTTAVRLDLVSGAGEPDDKPCPAGTAEVIV